MTRTWSLSRLPFSCFALSLTLLVSLLSPHPSYASRGGVEDPKNGFTVGFTYNDGSIPSVCSGALISPKIIVTTRHCIRSENGINGTDYVFTNPGALLDGPGAKSKIASVAITGEDLAFVVLDAPLSGWSPIRIADALEVANLKDLTPLVGHGYGAVYETGALYSSLVRKYPLTWRSSGKDPAIINTFQVTSKLSTACRGDSGGPITATLPSGEQVLVAIMSGAANVEGTCGNSGEDGLYRMRITLVHPYLGLIPEYFYQASKIMKITCVKGSKKKVISGLNPKCPAGYRLKKGF